MWGPKGKGVAPKERGTTSQKGMGSREIEVSKEKGVVSEEQGPVEMWPLGGQAPSEKLAFLWCRLQYPLWVTEEPPAAVSERAFAFLAYGPHPTAHSFS